jgi:hypothetical protein
LAPAPVLRRELGLLEGPPSWVSVRSRADRPNIGIVRVGPQLGMYVCANLVYYASCAKHWSSGTFLQRLFDGAKRTPAAEVSGLAKACVGSQSTGPIGLAGQRVFGVKAALAALAGRPSVVFYITEA